MSTATIALKCSDTALGLFHCESFTHQGKSYDVVLDSDNRNTCTCMAFALKIRNGGCGWTSESKEKNEYPNICPRCYAKTETYDTRDPETVDLDELMADFLALKKKLKKARA
jgi:hypothetical protein